MKTNKLNDGISATLIDVAKHAGVSPMTVSRVLNKYPKVRAETKERVLASVRALSYSPNQAARSLVSGKSRRICLLYANPSTAYLQNLMIGALEAMTRYGYQLVVKNISQDITPEELKNLMQDAWSGVIVPPPICDVISIRKMLDKQGVPAIYIGGSTPQFESFEIGVDDYNASLEMMEYLLSLGHKRIGFVKGHPNHSTSSIREKGYRDALQLASIPYDESLVAQGFFNYRSGLEAGKQLFQTETKPTAIFASNDDMAAGVLGAAVGLGMSVPDDVSIVGFDDSLIATTIWPNLTTVGQPLADMAGLAVDILHDILDEQKRKKPSKKVIFLEHSLIKRESAALL